MEFDTSGSYRDEMRPDELNSRRQLSLAKLNEDVLYQICLAADDIDEERRLLLARRHDPQFPPALLSLCTTCKRLRTIGTPLLYRRATVRRWDEPWNKASDSCSDLSSIENCEPFRRYGRVLSMDVAFYDRPYAAKRIKALLSVLRLLEKLRITSSMWMKDEFVEILLTVDFQLPNLCTLVVTSELQKLALKFNGITTLEIPSSPAGVSCDRTEIFREGKLRNLRHLELCPYGINNIWNPASLDNLLLECPRLATLGTVKPVYGESFLTLLPSLARFPALRVLAFNHLQNLAPQYQLLTYNVGSPPGNNRERDRFEREKAAGEVSEAVFDHCRRLQVLWMEDQGRAICKRQGDGSVGEISWNDEVRPQLFLDA